LYRFNRVNKKIASRDKQKSLADFSPPKQNYCLFHGAGFSKWAINLPIATKVI